MVKFCHLLMVGLIALTGSSAQAQSIGSLFTKPDTVVNAPIVSGSEEGVLWDGTKTEEGINLSVDLGLNLSQFTHSKRWNGIMPGVNVGIMAEKPILKSLSAKLGLFYTMKGTIGKNDVGFGGTVTTTFNPSYLEIPVLASYRYQLNEAIRLQFDFGPYFAFGLHGKDKKNTSFNFNGSYSKATETEYDLFGKDGQLKPFDFGFRFGPEVRWTAFKFGLAYEISAINISRMGGKVGNGNFMLNLGWEFLIF